MSQFKSMIIGLTISTIISFIIVYFSEMSFWIIFPIIVISLYLNGKLIEYEDNLPGGFNNPKIIKKNIFTYEQAEDYLIKQLSLDIESHVKGIYMDIGNGFEYYDLNLPRDEDLEYDNTHTLNYTRLFIALNFWDAWIDARNHDWLYYNGILKDTWPQLAQKIIKSIEEDNQITDSLILKYFS